MRRFPPPPANRQGHDSALSTPSAPKIKTGEKRSTESPMQYEYQTPRNILSTSAFNINLQGSAGSTMDIDQIDQIDMERASKRIHYEDMDLDTPPRPVSPIHILPPSDSLPLPIPTQTHSRQSSLEPPANPARRSRSISIGSSTSIEELETQLIKPSEARRRRNVRSTKSPEHRWSSGDEEGHTSSLGLGDSSVRGGGMVGDRMRNGEFSFQVHHHHGNGAIAEDHHAITRAAEKSGKWLDRNTPYTLLGYLHFTSLTLLLLLFLSIIILFVTTLFTDITDRLLSLSSEIQLEILACAKAYVDNHCDAPTRIPMSEQACSGWERCMSRDNRVQGKARVAAEVLAEIVNGFVEVISIRTMFFIVLSLSTLIYLTRLGLSLLPSPTTNQHPLPNNLPYGSQFSVAPNYQSHTDFQRYAPDGENSSNGTGSHRGGTVTDRIRDREGEKGGKGWWK